MLNNTDRMQGWCDSPLWHRTVAAVAEKLGQGLKKRQGSFLMRLFQRQRAGAIETADLVLRNCGQGGTMKKRTNDPWRCFWYLWRGNLRKPMEPPPRKRLGFQVWRDMMGAVFGGKISIYDAVTAMANTDENRIGGNMGRSTAASGGRHRENRGGSEIKRTEKMYLLVSHGMAISAFYQRLIRNRSRRAWNASITKRLFMMERHYCGKCKWHELCKGHGMNWSAKR